MLKALASLFKTLKDARSPIFASIALTTCFLLFSPSWFITTLGLTVILTSYRGYIALALVTSISFLIVFFSQWVVKRFQEKKSLQNHRKAQIQFLNELTPEEKGYLLPFIKDKQNTQYYLAENGIAGGLLIKDILYQASNLGNTYNGFAYNMQPWARNYLSENIHLLNGASIIPKIKSWGDGV